MNVITVDRNIRQVCELAQCMERHATAAEKQTTSQSSVAKVVQPSRIPLCQEETPETEYTKLAFLQLKKKLFQQQ